MSTLYERLGGAEAIDAAVTRFYWRILNDDRVRRFFEGRAIGVQIAKQRGFLTMVTGGPNNYQGKDLRRGHSHLVEAGLDDSHVDIVLEHLGATLIELGVEQETINDVLALADSVRDDVLNR